MTASRRARRAPRSRVALACAASLVAVACAGAGMAPATLDVRHDTCSHCRMAVSSQAFAAQIIAPGEEPRFFDDVGCLRAYLEQGATPAPRSVAFVASYRTHEWVPAREAVYLKDDTIETPMGFHYVAFASESERAAAASRGGSRLGPDDVFGPHLPGGTTR